MNSIPIDEVNLGKLSYVRDVDNVCSTCTLTTSNSTHWTGYVGREHDAIG